MRAPKERSIFVPYHLHEGALAPAVAGSRYKSMFTKKLSTCLDAICMSECAHPRLQGGGTKVRSQNNLSSFF